jgi:hypothetical protein
VVDCQQAAAMVRAAAPAAILLAVQICRQSTVDEHRVAEKEYISVSETFLTPNNCIYPLPDIYLSILVNQGHLSDIFFKFSRRKCSENLRHVTKFKHLSSHGSFWSRSFILLVVFFVLF